MDRFLVGLVAAAALASCGNLAGSIKPGTTEAAVLSTAGRPSASYPLPDGGKRLQYSGQPSSQFVWNIDLSPQGRVVVVEQVMSDAAFAKIRSGHDTRADVLREFGAPAETYTFPLKDETAWMYRYFIHGGFYAAMFIYFDPKGIVKRTETGMDPTRERDGNDRH